MVMLMGQCVCDKAVNRGGGSCALLVGDGAVDVVVVYYVWLSMCRQDSAVN